MPELHQDIQMLDDAAYRRRHGWNAGRLNELETKLVEAYGGYGTLRDSAVHAGISYNYARQIMARPHVRAYLASGKPRSEMEEQLRAEGRIFGREDMMSWLTTIVQDETRQDTVRVKAVETLAKMQGLLTERVVHEAAPAPSATHTDLQERVALVTEAWMQ